MSQKPLHTLAYCGDCESTHLGAPCGMTLLERLRTVKADSTVTATQTKRNFYDDQSVSEMFGGYTRKERKELYLDDTKGYGAITEKNPDPKHVEAVLGKSED